MVISTVTATSTSSSRTSEPDLADGVAERWHRSFPLATGRADPGVRPRMSGSSILTATTSWTWPRQLRPTVSRSCSTSPKRSAVRHAVPTGRTSQTARWREGDCQGAAWGDFDKDGRVDLYVTNWGEPNRLFRNLGGHLFSEVAGVALGPPGDSLSGRAVWGDCDNDGDLDLYVAQNLEFRISSGETRSAFVVATNGEPLSMASRHAHAAAWADYDEDGLIDLYIASSWEPAVFCTTMGWVSSRTPAIA